MKKRSALQMIERCATHQRGDEPPDGRITVPETDQSGALPTSRTMYDPTDTGVEGYRPLIVPSVGEGF